MPEPISSPVVCSKCGKELDTEGYPKWCRSCRTKYHGSYINMRTARGEQRGFTAGVEETKTILAQEFERLGSGSFSGYEIGKLIRQAPGPKIEG